MGGGRQKRVGRPAKVAGRGRKKAMVEQEDDDELASKPATTAIRTMKEYKKLLLHAKKLGKVGN